MPSGLRVQLPSWSQKKNFVINFNSLIFEKKRIKIITLIASIICGIWGYNILENKGHNPIVGGCLGFLLGIFGVFICYIFFDEVE